MIELPEALTAAGQINETLIGRQIVNVTAAQYPHKFAWYFGDPQKYHELLSGKTIIKADGFGSMVEINAGTAMIVASEGVGLRYHGAGETRPAKHQLLVEFDDDSALSASVQMYGGLYCFGEGKNDNHYYLVAKEKVSPLSDEFNYNYFNRMLSADGVQKLSVKAFLATEQRIPGLGNGVLQDILFNAGIHPKRKMNALKDKDIEKLFGSVKNTLAEMTFRGGRDTERDLFGCLGGYISKASKNTADKPCRICGSIIRKENYMGGSIYYCPSCQPI